MSPTTLIGTLALLAYFVAASEHILRLKEGIHSETTTVGVEEDSRVVIRCEHPSGKLDKLRWLYAGANVDTKYVRNVEGLPYLEIDKYISLEHDGVYECSTYITQDGMSASYRLRGEKKYELPEGYRYCVGEEMANCNHAAVCRVEISSKITSCVCQAGWMGASCNAIDSIRGYSVMTPPVCPYWPPVVTLVVFISVLFLLAICLYRFKVKSFSKNSGGYCKQSKATPEYSAVQRAPPNEDVEACVV